MTCALERGASVLCGRARLASPLARFYWTASQGTYTIPIGYGLISPGNLLDSTRMTSIELVSVTAPFSPRISRTASSTGTLPPRISRRTPNLTMCHCCCSIRRKHYRLRTAPCRTGSEALLADRASLDPSRQQFIKLCSSHRRVLRCFDLLIEELVEGGHQVLWWTFLDDVAHFLSKPN